MTRIKLANGKELIVLDINDVPINYDKRKHLEDISYHDFLQKDGLTMDDVNRAYIIVYMDMILKDKTTMLN